MNAAKRVGRLVKGPRKPLPTLEDFKQPQTQKYAAGNRPFPMNPYFIPKAPLNDTTRTTIYNLYMDEPEKWTVLKLAEQFGLSISRIEAILRLKALQDRFKAQGKPLHTDLVKGMEHMLGSKTLRLQERPLPPSEPIRETLANGTHPFIQLLDEEQRFTPNDAAKLLQLEPFENIAKRLDLKASAVFELEPKGTTPSAIESDPILGGKFDFMIVDTSAKDKIMVRDKEGNMRPASKPELWKVQSNKPTKYQM